MILTADEYRRGLLSWDIDTASNITVSCTETPDERRWSEPLTDPRGSRVPSEPGKYTEISVGVADRSALQRPFQIRWERADEGGIVTRIWENDLSRPPVVLRHVPNYGQFHRLVVFSPYLVWGDDPVIRVGDVAIRFITGRVVGEYTAPPSEVRVEEHTMTVTGEAGTAVAEGRFVEIVAPGETQADARQQAYTFLGLLAVCLGEEVVGEVVFAEDYRAVRGEQFGEMAVSVLKATPRQPTKAELEPIHRALASPTDDARMRRAWRFALRWYEWGLRTTVSLDELTSYLIGIETILNAYAEQHGPIPVVRDRQERHAQLLRDLSGELDAATMQRVRGGLVNATLRDRFDFYARDHQWDDAGLADRFRDLAKLRNQALHGDPSEPQKADVSQARNLLVRMLKAELHLPERMPWEDVLRDLSATVGYKVLGDAREFDEEGRLS